MRRTLNQSRRYAPAISLTPSKDGSMIVEALVNSEDPYQARQSRNLANETPFDLQLDGASPFVTSDLRPTGPGMFVRLGEIE